MFCGFVEWVVASWSRYRGTLLARLRLNMCVLSSFERRAALSDWRWERDFFLAWERRWRKKRRAARKRARKRRPKTMVRAMWDFVQ